MTLEAPSVRWARGGEAVVVSMSGEAIALRSTTSSPPGSRIEGTLRGYPASLRVKVHGCRRQPDGSFVIEGRILDLTRELRERLASRPT